MKSFAEYLTEANPVVDKQYRSEALRVFSKMLVTIQNLVKSNSTSHMKLGKNGRDTTLIVDVGELIHDKKYAGLRVEFGRVERDFGGSYTHKESLIYLAVMWGKQRRDPEYKMTGTNYDLHNGFIHSPAFVDKADVSNYEHLLSVVNQKRQEVKDIFVHEFVHHMDTLRYKTPEYSNEPTYNPKTGYGKEYFNHPKEVNAHTQEIIQSIDEWFKSYYLSAVNMLKNNLARKFNSANTPGELEDVSFIAAKFFSHYDMIDKYLSDKKYAMTSIREKIPSAKSNFAHYLTKENTRKVLVRLYQYYDEVLSKRFKLLQSTLENIPPKLNNKQAALYIKQHEPDAYKALRKMGMK